MTNSSYTYWLILAIALIAICSFFTFVFIHMVSPWDGALIPPGGISGEGIAVSVLSPQPNGLQDGDIVTAIGGVAVQRWVESLLGNSPQPLDWQIGHEVTYTVGRNGTPQDINVTLIPYSLWKVFKANWSTILYGMVFLVVGAYVFIRRPAHPSARILFLAAASITGQTAWSVGLTTFDILDGVGYWVYILCTMFFYSLNWIAMFHFTLLFPEPTELAKRRWFVLGIYLVPQSILLIGNGIQFVQSENTLDWIASGFWGQGVHASIFLFAALIGVIWQTFRSSNSKARQQIRWLLLSSIVMGLAVFSLYILPGVLGLDTISPNMLGLIITPFPIALGIAILRHNLFDIDTLFNRALVYGTLTLGTMTLYMIVVGVASTSLGIDNRSIVAFLTTGVVAVIFQPLRDRLQSWVNRRMYGYRDDPYQALSQLGNTLAKTFGSKDALPNILATVSETLKLPYVAIRLPGEAPISHGQLSSEADIEMFPLNYQGQSFGQLEVVPRSADEPFRPSELKLLQDLSRQIENAVHNLLLAEELQRSRQQLVTAREEERRRIRRDLHDGLGPLLASQAMTLEAIEEILEGDREQVVQLIQEMKDQSRDAIVDIRRLVYDLRPPELDNLGLTEALRQKFSHVSDEQVAIVFDAPVPTQVLPAAVEIAAYRIASEAITNVIRHADATQCIVLIRVEGDAFKLHVSDNGNGLPDQVTFGVGLSSIHERAEEIGGQVRIEQAKEGGMHILAELPMK